MTGLEYFSKQLKDENCVICMDSWFDIDEPLEKLFLQSVIGLDCDHFYHGICLDKCIKDQFIQCPVCTRIFGTKTGDQPEG
jgi:hypothetical protein